MSNFPQFFSPNPFNGNGIRSLPREHHHFPKKPKNSPLPTPPSIPDSAPESPEETQPETGPPANPNTTPDIPKETPTQTVPKSPSPVPIPNTPLPRNENQSTCPKIVVRKEWRSMDRESQKSYISAVKCLTRKPSILNTGRNLRHYDDFVSVHDRSRTRVHWVGKFLPWHRNFLHLYEKALNSCGYNGGIPRWDWSLDAENMTASPVWSPDPEAGFGGNGVNFAENVDGLGGGTVQDGAFARFQLLYPNRHFLQRGFNSPQEFNQGGTIYGSQYFDQNAVEVVKSSTDFLNFHVALEGTFPLSPGPDQPGPHGTIHATIGGDMSPTSFAANDIQRLLAHFILFRRIFYLHHSNVDCIWAQWQKEDPSRLKDFAGNLVQGSSSNDAKITDTMNFLGLGADITVEQAMDSSAAPYCYVCELLNVRHSLKKTIID
ncbi:hypothetical protein BY996DRAFT_4575143 [Phakopsora pachyrhizi]|uniref:Tyrosinase copper-binding domain-containing protein n=1 Tax=Phakopsora pachyrhizi TaxID=170000 RepID=A0AAV0BJD1_PHAPC|nr:hypothetical protein BY996DRAFT_4575143 [Phakopsora pachyrhizi]CAH7686077.1 hypothetical protein PPACK8108_LOCUS20680 [Phakopsora pachyrhizi]